MITKNIYTNFFIIFTTFLFLKYVKSQSEDTICQGNIECKTILIKNRIIYINSNETDYSIYCFDTKLRQNCTNWNRNHTNNITKNKNILNINNNEFLIFGFHRDKNTKPFTLYLERFSCNDSKEIPQQIGLKCYDNLNIFKIYQFSAKLIDNYKAIIFSAIIEDEIQAEVIKFKTFLIDLNDQNGGGIQEFSISDNNKFSSAITSTNTKKNIACDSLDKNNFLCVLSYDGGILTYINGHFSEEKEEVFVGIICSSDCNNANLITMNNGEYLVCYQKTEGSLLNIRSIVCQYYLYNSNYFKVGDSKTISTFILKEKEKQYILYKYKYTLFIVLQYSLEDTENSDLFLCSLDFKICYQVNLLKRDRDKELYITNIFSDDKYFYYIYKNGNTNLKKQEIIKCQKEENITLSEKYNKYKFDFINVHEGYEIRFSINKNINLIPNINIYNPETNSDKNFSFIKLDKSGVFDNYYFYSNKTHFSLICQINTTTCFSQCDNCTFGKEGTSTDNFCTKCKSGYFPKNEEQNSDHFNCFEQDELIENYYKGESGHFSKCNESCRYCINGDSCAACKDGYYFKYENSAIQNNTICFKSLEEYYLNNSKNIPNSYKDFNEIIYSVYERCFERCKNCPGRGDEINNNCLECQSPYKTYDINKHQCLIDHNNECFIKNKTWVLKDDYSNITCLDKCNNNIVLFGVNIGQCVKNCSNYKSLYFTDEILFTLIDCNNQNYCIPLDVCYKGKFKVFIHNRTCIRNPEVGCNVNVFDKIDPFAHDGDTVIVPTTHPITQAIKTTIIKTEKITQITSTSIDYKDDGLRKMKIIKIFSENENYTNYNIFDKDLIDDYIRMLKRESDNPYSININLIFLKVYANFIISIYPLEHEKYVYDNVIIPNNLGYINFTNIFKEINDNMNNGKLNDNSIKLVILLESISYNSPLNELNYYFCEFNEKTQERKFINLTESNFTTLLNVIYPLKNYYKENSTINKRNSEYLVDNIKEIYSKDPKIQIYNINDPLYNDICYHFDTGIDVEMTLDIKRKEFYVNKSLCEDNCYLEKLIINENVKSVCMCKLKSKFSFNKNAGVKDDIPLKSTNTAKSVYCFKETFNTNNIAKNPVFWAFLFIIIFVFALILIYIFIYRHKEFEGMFELNNKDSNVINNKINPDIDVNEIKVKNSINSSENENNNKSNEDNSISDISQIDKKDSESNKINNMVIKLNNRSIKNKSKKISLYDNSDNKDSLKNEEKNPIDLVSSNNKI